MVFLRKIEPQNIGITLCVQNIAMVSKREQHHVNNNRQMLAGRNASRFQQNINNSSSLLNSIFAKQQLQTTGTLDHKSKNGTLQI